MLDVSAQILGKYLSGARPAEVKELLKGTGSAQQPVSASGTPCQLSCFFKMPREGDICSIYVDDVRRADLPEDGAETEIFVSYIFYCFSKYSCNLNLL